MEETMQKNKIYTTTDYKQFKFLPTNRPIDKIWLKALIQAIREKNLLAENPINVNKKMEIIDGQHRLKAAEAEKKTLYYFFTDLGIKDAVLINRNQKRWSFVNYLEHYIKEGCQEYAKLKKFAEDNKIAYSLAGALLTLPPATSKSTRLRFSYTNFKKGKFKIVSKEDGQELLKITSQLQSFCEGKIWLDRYFMEAIFKIYKENEVSIDELLQKVKFYKNKLYRQATRINYLRQFEDVLNQGEKMKIRLT